MNHYDITIKWTAPFPKVWGSRFAGSSMAPAVSKGLRVWRRENKGKRINNVTINVVKI